MNSCRYRILWTVTSSGEMLRDDAGGLKLSHRGVLAHCFLTSGFRCAPRAAASTSKPLFGGTPT